MEPEDKLVVISDGEDNAGPIVTSDGDDGVVPVVVVDSDDEQVARWDFHLPKPKPKQAKTKGKVSNILSFTSLALAYTNI